MEDNKLLRICYSNVGVLEKDAEYQITGKSQGITSTIESNFSHNIVGNIRPVIAQSSAMLGSRVNQFEGIAEDSGYVYFFNTFVSTDDKGRISLITSALVADGPTWRHYMETPEKVFSCDKSAFFETTPSGARPGESVEIDALNTFPDNGHQFDLQALRVKFGLNDEKFKSLIECVYNCILKKEKELLIALPDDQLNNECARELMYCICMVLPVALRAQLTYIIGGASMGTVIRFVNAEKAIGQANYIDLSTDENKFSCEYLRGTSFVKDIIKYIGDDDFFGRMEHFLEETEIFSQNNNGTFFNADIDKYGRSYLASGAWLYGINEPAGYYEDGSENVAFTLCGLCKMVPNKLKSGNRFAWDSVTAGLMKQYSRNPLHGDNSDGEIHLDENSVTEALKNGWERISYPGSEFEKEFISFVSETSDRIDRFGKKCLAENRLPEYTRLLNSIYEKADIEKFVEWNPADWFVLREKYSEDTDANRLLRKTVFEKYDAIPLEKKRNLIDSVSYDESIAEEFLKHSQKTYDLLDDADATMHFEKIIKSFPAVADKVLKSDRFNSLGDDYAISLFRTVIDAFKNDEHYLVEKVYNSNRFGKLNNTQKVDLYKYYLGDNRNSEVFNSYVNLYASVLSEMPIEKFKTWATEKWYEFRKKFPYSEDFGKTISSVIHKKFSELDDEHKRFVINAADYNESGISEEFVSKSADVFGSFSDEEVVDKHFSKLVNNTSALADGVLNCDRFKTLGVESVSSLLNMVINKYPEDEKLMKRVLNVADNTEFTYLQIVKLFNTIFEKFADNDNFIINNIFNSGKFGGIGADEQYRLYKRFLERGRSTESVEKVLSSPAINEFTDDKIFDIYASAITSSVNDEKALAFTRYPAFEKLGTDYKYQMLSKLMSGRGEELCKAVLGIAENSEFSIEQMTSLFNTAYEKFAGNDGLVIDKIFKSAKFNALGGDAIYRLIERFFASKHDSSKQLEVVETAAFRSLGSDRVFGVLSNLIQASEAGFIPELYKTEAFRALPDDDRYKLVELRAEKLDDYKNCIGAGYLLERINSGNGLSSKLLALMDKEVNLLSDDDYSELYYDYLKGFRFNPSNPEAFSEIKKLNSINADNVKVFFERIFKENNNTWAEWTDLADAYTLEYVIGDKSFANPKEAYSCFAELTNNKLSKSAASVKTKLLSLVNQILSERENRNSNLTNIEALFNGNEELILAARNCYWENMRLDDIKVEDRGFYGRHETEDSKEKAMLFSELCDDIENVKSGVMPNNVRNIVRMLLGKGVKSERVSLAGMTDATQKVMMDSLAAGISKIDLRDIIKSPDLTLIRIFGPKKALDASDIDRLFDWVDKNRIRGEVVENWAEKSDRLKPLASVYKKKYKKHYGAKSEKGAGRIIIPIASVLAVLAALFFLVVKPTLELTDDIRGEWVNESTPTETAFTITGLCKYNSESGENKWLPGLKGTVSLNDIGKCTYTDDNGIDELYCAESGQTFVLKKDLGKLFEIVEINDDNINDYIGFAFEPNTDADNEFDVPENYRVISLSNCANADELTYLNCSEDFSIEIVSVCEEDGTETTEISNEPFFVWSFSNETENNDEKPIDTEEIVAGEDVVEIGETDNAESNPISCRVGNVNGTLYYVRNEYLDSNATEESGIITLKNGVRINTDTIR